MDVQEIGRQLRSRRAAAGRTVASVALDAGLSVPYVANLENGRGNPTLGALTRLASALGTRLTVGFEPIDQSTQSIQSAQSIFAEMPLSLVRLRRRGRFQRMIELISSNLDRDPDDLAAQILSSVTLLAAALGRDLAEADCWRLVDTVMLIAISPATDG